MHPHEKAPPIILPGIFARTYTKAGNCWKSRAGIPRPMDSLLIYLFKMVIFQFVFFAHVYQAGYWKSRMEGKSSISMVEFPLQTYWLPEGTSESS